MQLRLSSPVTVFLNITNACNLRCVYCSADSGVPSPEELSPDELHGLIDEMVGLKVCKVIVTGGEPFVRTDIFDLLDHMLEGGLVVSILSNGTMIRPRVAQRLVARRLTDISISLDGITPAVHDLTRGEGAFERTLAGVRTLLDHGVKPVILVTVTSANWCQIAAMVDELMELGVHSAGFNLMASLGRGGECGALCLDPEQMLQYVAELKRVKGKHPAFVKEDFLHWLTLPGRLVSRRAGNGPKLLPCDAAKTFCAIAADGTVYPCNRFTLHPCGNLREATLAQIWRGEEMERVRLLGQTPTTAAAGCRDCKYSVVCAGGCRADALTAFGDLEAPDPHCAVIPDSAVHGVSDGERLVSLGSRSSQRLSSFA